MRLGVLDVGSNSAQLQVVDVRSGARSGDVVPDRAQPVEQLALDGRALARGRARGVDRRHASTPIMTSNGIETLPSVMASAIAPPP